MEHRRRARLDRVLFALARRLAPVARLEREISDLREENASLAERLARMTATHDRLVEAFFQTASLAAPPAGRPAGRARPRGARPVERPDYLRVLH